MINANEVREITKKITEEQEKVKKETAIRLVNKIIEPSILLAAKRGEHSVIEEVEPEYLTYVRQEIENNGFTTRGIGQGKFRILW
jgi:hypothetical protein